MSGVAGRAGPEPAQDKAGRATSIRVAWAVHRRLLTIQYERKMAGESVTVSEIIGQLLDRAAARPGRRSMTGTSIGDWYWPGWRCTDPPEESCSDAACPVHGWPDVDNP